MSPPIFITLWRSSNAVRCELVERRAQQAFEVRLVRALEVLTSVVVPDTDTAYRVATVWRTEYHAPAPDAHPLKAA